MSRASGKNPFRPGVGTRPLHLAGREGPLRRFGAMLRAAPEQPANMRLIGLRGVGKTVLLGEFATLAEEQGWAPIVTELQAGHNREDALVTLLSGEEVALRERMSRRARILRRTGRAVRSAVESVELRLGDLSMSIDSGAGPQVGPLAQMLSALVTEAVEQGHTGVVVMLDEAQVLRDETKASGRHPLSMLIAAVAAVQREEQPLGLVLCGLPTLTANLLRARSYTERMFRGEEIGSLEPSEAAEAFTEPLAGGAVSAKPVLVTRVVSEVEGYPYFVQLWGAELWDAAVDAGVARLDLSLLEAIVGDIYRRLDVDFYEPRVMTLTPAEQDLLLATVECRTYPPLLAGEINAVSDKRPGNINVLLGRLVEQGVLYRIRKGQYDYTAPKFRQYLQRRVR